MSNRGGIAGGPTKAQRDAMASGLAAEVAFRLAIGWRQVSLKEFDAALGALGYRLDRSGDCPQISRGGAGQVQCYPMTYMQVRQISDGKTAWNVDARRDENFKRLQAMRGAGPGLFAVARGYLYEI